MTMGYVATLRNSMLNAITTAMGTSGLLRIYSGTRPATGGTETTKLAELPCSATFAPAASGGVLTVNSITTANAVASGTASWWRFCTSGGTAVIDGACGTSGTDMVMTSTTITSGISVSCSSATITAGNP